MLWAIIRKEIRVEWRTREVLYTSTFFAVLLATVFMFGFQEGSRRAREVGPGILWVALTFAGTIAFTRSFEREREAGCLAALRLVPGIHLPLFFGKCCASFLWMAAMEVVLVPLVAVLFDLPLRAMWWQLLALLALGTFGLCVLGTVLGAALANIRLRTVLLPLVLFPLVVPLLVAGVSATEAAREGDGQLVVEWMGLMVAFDAIYVTLSVWLFRPVLEATE